LNVGGEGGTAGNILVGYAVDKPLNSEVKTESLFMNAKKIALAAAVAGTLGAAGSANATIIGVPSEGLLVPLGVHGVNDEDPFFYLGAYTGVLIETPALVGADTIINDYTAPNTTKGGYTPPEAKGEWDGGMTVHYYMFDDKSNHVYDNVFVMSPDDVYFWMPPYGVFDYGDGGQDWIGYVVFADDAARKGGPATFVMTGQAGIAFDYWHADDILDVPVVPLADGDDAGGIRIGNEITYSKQQLPRIDDVVPIVAGTRYYGAPGTTTTIVTGLIPLQYGSLMYPDLFAISHVMWFSENGMRADIDFCDDEEWCVSCRDWTFSEVNILDYDFEGNLRNGVQDFKDAFVFNAAEDCEPNTFCGFYPDPVGDTCGVSINGNMSGDGDIDPNAFISDYGHYAGIGMALYEFASKVGVAGINFQFGISYVEGDNLLTHPMLTNGQF